MPDTPASTLAQPAADAVLGIDVGGTSIKARLIGGNGAVLSTHRTPTPHDDPTGTKLATSIRDIARIGTTTATTYRTAIGAIGVVVPGIVDEAAGIVRHAVNLGWHDLPLLDVLRTTLATDGITLPVAFGQDVRAGALAEADRTDLTDSHGPLLFVPVGTGIASALIINGTVLAAEGWAGEIGQVRIVNGPHRGKRVEEIASASAVAARTGTTNAEETAQRVRDGDPHAQQIWNECVDVLAEALAWATAVTGCETIIVGGGLARSGTLLLDPLTATIAERLPDVRTPRLLPAIHDDIAAAVGAAQLARTLLNHGGR